MSDQLLPYFNLKTTECNLRDPQGPELPSFPNQSWQRWEAQEPPLLHFLVKSIGLGLQIQGALMTSRLPCGHFVKLISALLIHLLLAWLLLCMLPCALFPFKDSRQQ